MKYHFRVTARLPGEREDQERSIRNEIVATLADISRALDVIVTSTHKEMSHFKVEIQRLSSW